MMFTGFSPTNSRGNYLFINTNTLKVVRIRDIILLGKLHKERSEVSSSYLPIFDVEVRPYSQTPQVITICQYDDDTYQEIIVINDDDMDNA